MTKSEFLKEIEMIIEADPGVITMDDQLESLDGWDSMAVISFIAMVDEKLSVVVNITSLESCRTIGDLAGLCENNVA